MTTQWTKRHAACIECHETSRRHMGGGFCTRCYARKYRYGEIGRSGAIGVKAFPRVGPESVTPGAPESRIRMAIPLTRGKVTFVDQDVYAWASKVKWQARPDRHGVWYAQRSVRAGRRTTTIKLHRLIVGEEALRGGLEPDHIDRNGLNNWRSNLRAVTRAENIANSRTGTRHGHGASGLRNVYRMQSGRFEVRLTKAKKPVQIGTFDTIEQADAAAREARRTYFGEE